MSGSTFASCSNVANVCRQDFGQVAWGSPMACMTRTKEVRTRSALTAPASRQTVRATCKAAVRVRLPPAAACRSRQYRGKRMRGEEEGEGKK